jgi:hypothetical protein
MMGNCKINSMCSNTHSKCEHTIIQSCCKNSKCFSDLYSNSTQKQASFTVTPPRHGEAQDLEGGYVILPHAQDFISTSGTLVQIGM